MASRDGTLIVRQNVSLIDAAGNSWFFKNGQVYQNGNADPFTSRVIAIGYVNGQVVQENADKLWWAKTGNGWGGWNTPGNPDEHIASPFGQSYLGTLTAPSSAQPLVDASGNLWWIDGGKVVENGVAEKLTNNVILMAIDGKGDVFQENSQHLWWKKTYEGYGGWGTSGTPDGHITYPPPNPTLGGHDPWPPSQLWVGASNADPTKAANWSSGVVPTSGTEFDMAGGSINIAGKALSGVSIGTRGYGDETAFINMSGTTNIPKVYTTGGFATSGGPITVNLAANSQWVGGFVANYYGYPIIVQGAGKFSNTASSSIGNHAVVDADVVGTGTFNVDAARYGSSLEFMKGISPGQSINLGGSPYLGHSTLQVDDPKAFEGSVTLGEAEVIMKGLVADSYSLKNDLLSMYKLGGVVDTLPLKVVSGELNGPHRCAGFRRIAGRRGRGAARDQRCLWGDAVAAGCLNLVLAPAELAQGFRRRRDRGSEDEQGFLARQYVRFPHMLPKTARPARCRLATAWRSAM
jgi:hypothetical protein